MTDAARPLRCRPGQLALIKVPESAMHYLMGLLQNNGHVVRVVRLVTESGWEVDPPQSSRVVGPLPPKVGVKAGDVVEWVAVPDEYLVPFDAQPEALVDGADEGLSLPVQVPRVVEPSC